MNCQQGTSVAKADERRSRVGLQRARESGFPTGRSGQKEGVARSQDREARAGRTHPSGMVQLPTSPDRRNSGFSAALCLAVEPTTGRSLD